jgi:hypothetical protein
MNTLRPWNCILLLGYCLLSVNAHAGEAFEGELTADSPKVGGFYTASITINLKAGQSLEVLANVKGVNRGVGVAVFDPTNREVQRYEFSNNKSITHKIAEVNATGKYKVNIFSDAIGPFSYQLKSDQDLVPNNVTVKNPPKNANPAEQANAKQLEKRVQDLETEVLELKKELSLLKNQLQNKINSR